MSGGTFDDGLAIPSHYPANSLTRLGLNTHFVSQLHLLPRVLC